MSEATRPNVLLFCVDEMRADHLACAGNPHVQTPNLDRLAARGTLFRGGACNNPICMPARATLFTGLLPRDHGLRVNGQRMHPGLPTLPGVLAEAGYRTHAAGKLHLTPWRPLADPPDPAANPECMDSWSAGAIRSFPTPYYGFQTVDFVGGHTAYAYGPYLHWLEAQGVDPKLLKPERALEPPTDAPQCYKMGLPEELHYNRWIADSTIHCIEAGAADGAAPWFAWCSFPDPHAPLGPPAPYCDLYAPETMPLPARREGEIDDLPPVYRRVVEGAVRPNGTDSRPRPDAHWQEMLARTYGMITHLDAEVGRVLDALDRTGQADRTVLAFVSDHGDMMGDHGLIWKSFYTFRACTRIPFLLAAPGCPGGRSTDALAAQVDLFPTVLDLCGAPLPGADWPATETPFERGIEAPLRLYPGRSLRPVLDGTAGAVRDRVVIENDDPTTGYRVRSLLTPTHRLAVYPGTPDGELIDLAADPDELHNLWYRAGRRALRDRLTAELLDAYAAETPLYPVPAWNA